METTMLNQFMNSFPDFLLGHLGVDLSATDGLVEGRHFARAGRSHNLGVGRKVFGNIFLTVLYAYQKA